MAADLVEQVVEEGNASRDLAVAPSIKAKAHPHVGFAGGAVDPACADLL
jgi:hypothetical protein